MKDVWGETITNVEPQKVNKKKIIIAIIIAIIVITVITLLISFFDFIFIKQ